MPWLDFILSWLYNTMKAEEFAWEDARDWHHTMISTGGTLFKIHVALLKYIHTVLQGAW
jgi:hypothetical protein